MGLLDSDFNNLTANPARSIANQDQHLSWSTPTSAPSDRHNKIPDEIPDNKKKSRGKNKQISSQKHGQHGSPKDENVSKAEEKITKTNFTTSQAGEELPKNFKSANNP